MKNKCNCKKNTQTMFKILCKNLNLQSKINIINEPDCPIYILENLYDNGFCEFDIKNNLAKLEKCPIHILEELSKCNDKIIKVSLLKNNKCTEMIMRNIYNEDYFFEFSEYLIKNKNCPLDLLKKVYIKSKEYNYYGFIDNIKSHNNWKLNDFE
mgnify:CR=1 FL=1